MRSGIVTSGSLSMLLGASIAGAAGMPSGAAAQAANSGWMVHVYSWAKNPSQIRAH